jgi:leucyl/phenylalanyl-tRNA--protein transferase
VRGKFTAGPDPGFPYLTEHERLRFPEAASAREGIVAAGGNLSPGMLLSAYEQGIFPWYNEGEPVLWHSPDPRFVIFPEELHVSASMRKILRRGVFEIRYDFDFPAVISGCASIESRQQKGTWISDDIISAYIALHHLGYAHSAESYCEGRLAGGCYGVMLGRLFFGESMFSLAPNASKAAFLSFAERIFSEGAALIDCQVPSEHLKSLGAREISRKHFLELLRKYISVAE